MTEDLSVDIFLLGLRRGVSPYRTSHVRLYFNLQTLFRLYDGGYVELPSGRRTELRLRLRYAHGTPTLHFLSTVS